MTHSRYQKISRVLYMVLVLNAVVALCKLGFGLSFKIMSMTADGVHSLLDSLNNVIGLISIGVARKPADRDHHYGHERFEVIAALGISFFIFLAAYEIFKRAIFRLLAPSPITGSFEPLLLIVMGGCLIINILVAHYERQKGIQLKSQILLADALHTQTDIALTFSVITALLAMRFGLPVFDLIVSMGISVYLTLAAFRLFKWNVLILSDVAIIEPNSIEQVVNTVDGVLDCHKIRTRGTPGQAYVDLHIQVDPKLPTLQSHRIAHQVSAAIKEQIDGVKEVLVHTEPLGPEAQDDL